MDFEFKRHRRDKVSQETALETMEQAAAFFGYVEFGKRDLTRAGVRLSASAVRNAFNGSWTAALEALRVRLRQKGKDLRRRSRTIWSDEDMFEEMRRIWGQIGHRPSQDEWNSATPKISYNAYRQRFRGWENACLRFIEYQMQRPAEAGSTEQVVGGAKATGVVQPVTDQRSAAARRTELGDRRDPSQALINKVWKRDHFRCRQCGRSPAIHFGVVLEVDHIIPWAQGGKTIPENLQTLCSNCNRSKKDEMPSARGGV